MSAHCAGPTAAPASGQVRVAVVGSPNAGKTTVFNALTRSRAKTANYPGVTVARTVGTTRAGRGDVLVEDLPGTYSLHPLSPDEQVTVDVLDGTVPGLEHPDAVLVVVDATTLRRSAGLLAQVLRRDLPVCVVLTFGDELAARGGTLDVDRLARALGVPVVPVVARLGTGLDALRERLAELHDPADDGPADGGPAETRDGWPRPVVPPPDDPAEADAWARSVLAAAGYRPPRPDGATARVDAVLLHPLWGSLVLLAVLVLFFQTVFAVAAPLQSLVEAGVGRLAGLVHASVGPGWLAGLLGDAVVGGAGGVLAFVPQIALLFLLVALLEGSGYMARAAFLVDRVMAAAGLEGRAFVALLSSVACAVPGIMATRTLPSERARLATMLAAPLMTCSARLPVYVLLVGILVDPAARVGPFGAQGLVMFGLYVLGALSATLVAAAFRRLGPHRDDPLPFHLELPPYRVPSVATVAVTVRQAVGAFLRKVSTIIVTTSVVLWLLLSFPLASAQDLAAAGVDARDPAAVSAYTTAHSAAAALGHAVEPVFAPLGFDWRIDVGLLSAQAARETFVATTAQLAAAEGGDPARLTVLDGPDAGTPLLTPATTAALLVWFVYALQCTATVGVIRRESGSWRWPLVALAYSTALAWGAAWLARALVLAVTG